MEVDSRNVLESMLQPIMLVDREDSWLWDNGGSSGFEVAEVKKWLRGPVIGARSEFRWCPWVTAKCNIFMWRAYLDRLPTKTALARRNIMVDNLSCVWCQFYDESIEHLLTGCATVTGVWDKIASWCGIPRPFLFHVKDVVLIHEQSGISGIKKEVLHGIIIITSWRLWRARNEKIFNGLDTNVVKLVADIKALGYLWYKNRYKGGIVDWSRWCAFDVT